MWNVLLCSRRNAFSRLLIVCNLILKSIACVEKTTGWLRCSHAESKCSSDICPTKGGQVCVRGVCFGRSVRTIWFDWLAPIRCRVVAGCVSRFSSLRWNLIWVGVRLTWSEWVRCKSETAANFHIDQNYCCQMQLRFADSTVERRWNRAGCAVCYHRSVHSFVWRSSQVSQRFNSLNGLFVQHILKFWQEIRSANSHAFRSMSEANSSTRIPTGWNKVIGTSTTHHSEDNGLFSPSISTSNTS